MSSSRNWCFTVNRWLPFEWKQISEYAVTQKYCVMGKELGKLNKTPHIQGYIEFNSAKTLEQVAKLPGFERAHLEKRRGTQEEAVNYCKKDKEFWESKPFEPNEPGKRTDIEIVKEIINEGGSMLEITQAVNSYQAMRCGELLLKYHRLSHRLKPTVYWFWGESGSGKTKEAVEVAFRTGKGDYYMSMGNLKWWDGYYGQAAVIIDDIRPGDIAFNFLLRLLDRYPLRVENKGGSVEFKAECIILTSIQNPKDWKTGDDEPVEQLLRRIDLIVEFKAEPKVPDVVSSTTTEV